MLRIQRVSILLFVGLLHATIVRSQGFAIRNNLLYDATLTPNFGVEMRLDSVWTMGLNAGFNLWDYDKAKNKKWRHILISPNFRHYNDTLFRKSFWGLHAVYSHYNVSNVKFPFGMYKDVRDKRLQGDLVAIGGSFGYNWWLTGRLHLEAEIGDDSADRDAEQHCGAEAPGWLAEHQAKRQQDQKNAALSQQRDKLKERSKEASGDMIQAMNRACDSLVEACKGGVDPLGRCSYLHEVFSCND